MKGNPHLKTAVVEAAWSASRTDGSEFQLRYQRLHPRLGHKRALVAAAHSLVIRIYQVLSEATPYQPPPTAIPPRKVRRLIRHHTRRLRCLHHWLKQDQTPQ